jgi:hypothetical protein
MGNTPLPDVSKAPQVAHPAPLRYLSTYWALVLVDRSRSHHSLRPRPYPTCLARLTAHSENKDAAALPAPRAAAGLCAG